MTDDLRLETLENAVRALADQLRALRADVAELRAAPGATSSAGSGEPLAPRDVTPPVFSTPPLDEPRSAAGLRAGGPPRHHDAPAAAAAPHPAAAPRTSAPRTSAPPAGDYAFRGVADVAADRVTNGAAAARPGPSAGRAARAGSGASLENLVGRYGTLALATLTILMGVGAFVSWAIANAHLGPELRVGLGVALAAIVAGIGFWLRARGTVRFGNTMLGLALAIIHVDAWGAGPNLGLVSPTVALAIAALASEALAALALRSDEQPLFAVGIGGALLAPFITSDGGGLASLLLTYGLVVIAAALAALRGRRWPVAARMIGLSIPVYVAAGLSAASVGPLAERMAAPLFALACAATALAVAGRPHRRSLARVGLLAAATALMAVIVDYGDPRIGATRAVLIAVGVAATAWAATFLDDEEAAAYWPVDAVLLPLLALVVGLIALPDVVSAAGAATAAGWALAAAGAAALARERHAPYRPAHALAAALAGTLAIVLAAGPGTTPVVIALGAWAVLLGLAQHRLLMERLAGPALLSLGLASAWTYERLGARPAFGYTPFLTSASGLALAVVACWAAWTWLATATADARTRALRAAPAAAVAFWWGRTELAGAGSPELASFLLTLYYAATGVAAILAGRLRAAAAARHVGLALALFAALRALVVASDLHRVQLRVGSYLLVGVFLLGVAYWYRTAGDAEAAAAPPAEGPAGA